MYAKCISGGWPDITVTMEVEKAIMNKIAQWISCLYNAIKKTDCSTCIKSQVKRIVSKHCTNIFKRHSDLALVYSIGLAQDCCNSIANILELPRCYAKSWMCSNISTYVHLCVYIIPISDLSNPIKLFRA